MYLKSLEMQGFKSFPDKTKLTFDEKDGDLSRAGVTVIVGPNGSGKSNISDAMRWVLGEISSKSLRGSKMEDVIFGGADSRKPMGYAEVSVTFDNRDGDQRLDCPFDEVTVTRRYYRAGESEYYINRRAVRLKDIYELFMNTGIGRDGYSIIGQGRIAEMVSRKSEERRSIFEDASGIAKYRHRKTDAERKLEMAEENITRTRDIFTVIEAQVGPLEKEAERARRAMDLIENKKRADVSLWLYDTERLRRDLDRAEEALNHSAFDLQTATDALATIEEQSNRLFEQRQSTQQKSAELLGQIQTLNDRNHALEGDCRVRESELAHTKELIAATEGTTESTERSRRAEEADCERHRARIGKIGDTLTALEKERGELAAEQTAVAGKIRELEENLATAQSDILEWEEQATDLRVRLSVIENAQGTDEQKNDAMRAELENYCKTSETLAAQCETCRGNVANYDTQLTALEQEMTTVQAALDEERARLASLTEERNDTTLRRDSLTQRINTYRTMEENFEGYANSVRYVMKEYARGQITDRNGAPCGTIYGPLSQLISVEDRFVTAIETALGANLQNIVVADEATAKAAMACLKRGEAGRATFFPLTSMRPQSATKEMNAARGYVGYVGVADELIRAESKFSGVLSALLGRTVIFDNIDNATTMARATGFRVRAVTLDGQQINVGGSFTGGSVRQRGSVLSRAGEIKRMEAESEELTAALAALTRKMDAVNEKIRQGEEQMGDADSQKSLISLLRSSEAAKLEQVTAKRDANDTLMNKLSAEYDQITRMHAQYAEERETLLAEERELRHRIDEVRGAREEMDGKRLDLEDRKEEIAGELTEKFVRISAAQKDEETEKMLLATAEERLAAYAVQLEELTARAGEYARKVELLTSVIAENREAYEAGQAELGELTAKRKLIEDDGLEFERKITALNRRLREKMDEKEQLARVHMKNENKLEQLRAEQDKLSGKLWEEYELTRADALALNYPPVTADNRLTILALQTECRNKLRGMGNVDLNAVEKYNEVKGKYDTMKEQLSDMERGRSELLSIIGDLEEQMKTAFVESFNQINDNFGRVFAELFGGGSAELSLTDPENVLESGIEIKAAPPGKIIKNLMQLSGGEQSFIGVALFFAILQVNPTPFCILDEIEAALDEVNVERLAQYIRRYSHGTQFIMITHRRGTMAAATRLYGVTMPEHGISKVLTLDVADISKNKEGSWNGLFN